MSEETEDKEVLCPNCGDTLAEVDVIPGRSRGSRCPEEVTRRRGEEKRHAIFLVHKDDRLEDSLRDAHQIWDLHADRNEEKLS